MAETAIDEQKQLSHRIAKIFDESRSSYATHNRKLKELSNLRSSSPQHFFFSLCRALSPIFTFQRRTASAERVIRFVSVFASAKSSAGDDVFLEDFLRFLLSGTTAAAKTARFRSCQIISEIIMRLPDDAEVSDDLWDEVIDSMMLRVGDKIPVIRTFAIRALSRFVNDSENSDILELFLQTLDSEQNALSAATVQDVRKTIILALPPSNATSVVIMGCTLDVSESVRKAAYFVLANKFPLQSLSIKLRALILQRGLSDRSPAVVKECLKLMKDEWLSRCCDGNCVKLLKYLDVETYESVGISIMTALLEAEMIAMDGSQRIKKFKESSCAEDGDNCNQDFQLLEPEAALYWRVVCQYLQTQAQEKGSDAAATMGTEAAVYAAEASDNNDLLEKLLPATVSEYVELVQAHINAGPNYRFVSRQLLLLGALLDFSDATIRRIAGTFVQDLLRRPIEYEMDSDGNKLVIGDGINLGGDRDWANAVAGLIKKVHAADGEFEEVVLGVVGELARPCRERTADFLEWMHCLAVIGLLLENMKSFRCLQGKSIEPCELMNSLLLPGAKHLNLDVQRVAVRCLGLYGLLERKPSEEVVNQLVLSFVKGPSPVSLLAGEGLIDLLMWQGPQEVDRVIGQDALLQVRDRRVDLTADLCRKNCDVNLGVLDLLFAGLGSGVLSKTMDSDENEYVKAALGEGFAKILLLSENYPSIPASLHSLILVKLINMYFSEENHELQRYTCITFLEILSKHLSEAFVPVLRATWPGINGNHGGSTTMISNMRKRAVQASRFMLQMMQSRLYQKEADDNSDGVSEDHEGTVESSDDFETGEEGLAIRIATEVASFHMKKTAAEKSYISALCKIIVLLHFRVSEQGAIKLMRVLLNRIVESVSHDKEVSKELTNLAGNLKSLDRSPDEELPQDQANTILERLGLDYKVNEHHSREVPPTPAPRSTRPNRSRRRAKCEESSSSDEDGSDSLTSAVPTSAVGLSSTRSQRASKTAALTKMTASRAAKIAFDEIEEEDEEDGSDLMSEEESDDSDSLAQ
ncbi:hypothetical protein Cgig2_024969 [Carnegiea gigantea]|uniref:Nuclear condensin complex subunit 3 C-terminal domain-containing protein n=1 Tax=Carnegiea gigantea TaxID=171969 RepID=A0A9Q1JQ18_9CARY|nr:hypothetical protein Cgig2_024969 [Carnegiea gigantea]